MYSGVRCYLEGEGDQSGRGILAISLLTGFCGRCFSSRHWKKSIQPTVWLVQQGLARRTYADEADTQYIPPQNIGKKNPRQEFGRSAQETLNRIEI